MKDLTDDTYVWLSEFALYQTKQEKEKSEQKVADQEPMERCLGGPSASDYRRGTSMLVLCFMYLQA